MSAYGASSLIRTDDLALCLPMFNHYPFLVFFQFVLIVHNLLQN